ncbi:hypothetical protein PoB_006672900 [Plakobranchus ocellatus]|uniref:Fibronectin type-III domain-containing protein n=1 Tax=Plakobranchus ocellatus TaxID=259542 RepID=A0AAV4D7P3_9GAST|nr:hypothetical protein PoB_006672900 [Plakobranchus ocellatus]
MSPSIAKYGNFTIKLYQTDNWYNIPFSLIPYQKPLCPESLTIEQVGDSFVVLSWTPAPDRGISQTFTVSQIDAGNAIVDSIDVENTWESHVFYSITRLDPGSEHSFNLSVANVAGVTECPQLTANAKALSFNSSADISALALPIVIAAVIFTFAIILWFIVVRKKRETMKPQRQSPVHHPTNTGTELPMPARDVGYIEMRARNCDEQVRSQLKIPLSNIHVENTDRTPQASSEDDAGYVEIQDVRLHNCFQDQPKIAIENINCESGTVKGEYKRICITGGEIECNLDLSINDSYTRSSREECADTIVKKRFDHAISEGEYANAISSTQCTNAATNKEYANAIVFTQCTNAAANKEYANAITSTQCTNAATNKEYANAISSTQCTNAATNKEYANAIDDDPTWRHSSAVWKPVLS